MTAMRTIGIVVAWAMCALLVLILLLVPLARHADRRGQPGLLSNAVAKLRRLSLSALLALAIAFGGSVAYSGKTNGVQNLPPRPMLQLPAPTPPSIFDYPRTVTDSRAASGFALVGVGTNETFTFDPPMNATVCADWRMYGSASRWAHVSPTNFAFPFGGTNATTFTFVPGGVAEFAGGADAPRIAPFDAKMGIASERCWDSLGVTSRFWTATSPSNTFLATWHGALLGRRADSPVDVQLELFPDGGFDFRYDLSRCGALGEHALPDVRVGAWNAGGGEWYSVPQRNLTSARWRPVAPEDATDPDRDNDGVTTVDELFFLGTDPGNPDSDFDGLSDGEEITHGLNPLDAYSNGGPYTDGFAAKIGDLNPLACPQDSTYTFYEHVIYSGSTNGMVTVPASTAAFALLEVDVSGTGTGDLVVGTQSLPLVAGAPTMRLAVPRGSRLAVRLRRRTGSLAAFVGSDDFAIGEMPDAVAGDPTGWISFPRTRPIPEVACIHDLSERKITVRIDPGYGAEGVSATWWGTAAVAASNHADNLSATLMGNFDAHHTARVWYALDHPLRLLGMGSYWQAVRFCPRPSDASDEPVDDPWGAPWYVPDPTNPGPYDDLYDGESPGTHPPLCGCCSSCPLTNGAGCEHHTPAPSEVSGPAPSDPQSLCPVHSCPYSECADLHGDAAPRTAWVPTSTHVLKIGRMPTIDTVALMVPDGVVNCCPCPDHWTNWVGVAHLPDHVAVKGDDGQDFRKSETNCTAYVSGTSPTRLSERASLAFATNGTIHIRRDYVVLGVDVDTPARTASLLNALNPSFGVPATVCTNASRAAGIDLVTRVRLAAGAVTLTAGEGAFQAWLDRSSTGEPPLFLVDGTTRPTVTMSLAKWRSLASLTGDENEARTRILLTSAAPGSRTLTFSFSAGGELNDAVVQRITFVKPPLRLDITRDGSIDDGDAAAWHDGRTFYYWINEDKFSGDWINQGPNLIPNTWDFTVNGTFDLVNLFPVALDLSAFTTAWQNRVTYTVKPKWGNANTFNFCFADVPWSGAGSIQTTNVTTTAGQTLSAASLTALPSEGYALPYSFLTSFSEDSGLMICEAKSEYASLQIDIKDGDTVLYRYYAPMTILPVKQMYNWYNFRNYSGQGRKRNSEQHILPEEHNTKSLIFLHGANVNEDEAEVWGDVLFKRLWLSGMHADFYNVDWRSDIGTDVNYQQNSSNAFVVASQIVSTLTNSIPGERVIMAHSLGNMVVSSMIHDYGMQVSKYLMCNSAVPAEAFDVSMSLRTSKLVHPEWVEYPTNSWTASWHTLFKNDLNDDRQYLGWPGRFTGVLAVAVNFYSTGDNGGDEVLELYNKNTIGVTTGISNSLGHYSWHKQEMFKGRGGIGGTDWSGWNIEEDMLGRNKISVSNALEMTDADFKTNTVFYCYPSSMNSTNISLLVRGAHLAKGIPALTSAAGAMQFGGSLMEQRMINLNDPNDGISRPNGWPSRSSYPDRWLHSDMKDVSYFFNFMFFKKVVEKGSLQ